MNIGVPYEVRVGESRVGLTPAGVRQLVHRGHRIHVQRGAGERTGFSDGDYIEAGARLVYSPEEVYWRSDLIVKVVRPTEAEFGLLKEDSALLSFLQLTSARSSKIERLLRKRVTAIALDSIQLDDGTLPVLHAMSQIGARMTPGLAARFLETGRGGTGVLLSGVPGVPPAEVVIVGAGMFGQEATRALSDAGANLYVLDKDIRTLIEIERHRRHGRVSTMLAHPENIAKAIRFADVVVTAAQLPDQRAPILITEEMVRTMRPGSLIMDVSITQGGCVQTSRPTTHLDPVFQYGGVTHYCVPNMPSAVARTATHALVNRTRPIIEMIAELGVEGAIRRDRALARGVWTRGGELMHQLGPSDELLED